jgi:hypothetical protein
VSAGCASLPVARVVRLGVVVVLGLAAAGCSTPGAVVQTADVRGATVTIESVEGAPAPVFHRFIREINAEAAERQVALVLWGGGAKFRLRGYLAAHTSEQPPTIAWAWDVYDTDQHHIFRLTGEEVAPAGRQSWAAADDAVLGRIAHAGMEQLVAVIATSRPQKSPALGPTAASKPAPGYGRSILAAIDDYTPEAAGVFRILGAGTPAPMLDAAFAADAPLPRERPFAAEETALAFGAAGR